MRFLPASALALWLAAVLVSGCGTEEKRYVPNAGDGETTPTMATTDVSTLVSDSGYTRYHIETPLWQMFEDAENPFWRFPDGLAMEQYDLELNPVASVVCDSAIYFSRPPMAPRRKCGDGQYRCRFVPHPAIVLGPEPAKDLFRLLHPYSAFRQDNRRLRFRVGAEHALLSGEKTHGHPPRRPRDPSP